MRRIAFASMAAVLTGAIVAADLADAATCFTLQAELEHLQSQGAGGGDRRRYERAYREQANVIARTEARARRAGCFGGGFFLFQRAPERSCRVLVAKLRDMQSNLGRLDRMRRRSGGGNERRIRQIQAAMAARSCGVPGRDQWEEARNGNRPVEREAPYSARGTFRTLCVRTCDGYYFPISFATTSERFGDDAQICSSMCPGAQSELFYHPNPGGSPEDMISLSQQRYSDLSTAFQYRTSLNPFCSCKPAGGYSQIAANPIGDVSNQPVAAATAPPPAFIPRPRPSPGEDPETLANRSGGLSPASPPGGPRPVGAVSLDGRAVRVVGPAYWGARSQEEVILTPVPN